MPRSLHKVDSRSAPDHFLIAPQCQTLDATQGFFFPCEDLVTASSIPDALVQWHNGQPSFVSQLEETWGNDRVEVAIEGQELVS